MPRTSDTRQNPEPLTRLTRLYLYDEPEAPGLDVDHLGGYLAAVLPACEAHPRSDFLTHHLARFTDEQRETLGEQLLGQLQRARVTNLVPPALRDSLPAEDPVEAGWEEVYHSPSLQAVLHLLIPPEESHLSDLHLSLTNLRLGRWPAADRPFRLSPALFGEPNLLSLTSLLEGPETSREYQFLRVQMAMFGLEEGLEVVEDRFAPRMLAEGDPRLNETVKGLLLQAVFYRLFGEAFCPDPACRLYNATAQEELLEAQTGPGRDCARGTGSGCGRWRERRRGREAGEPHPRARSARAAPSPSPAAREEGTEGEVEKAVGGREGYGPKEGRHGT